MTSTIGRSADRSVRPRHWLRTAAASGAISGFTLFELVLVMLIVSVLAAIAAPSMRNFLAGRSNANAASQILALAQYARTQAVGAGAVYRLNVDTSGGTYWLSVQSGTEFQTLRSEFGRPFRLPEGTTAAWQSAGAAEQYFQFFPDGRIEAGTLELRSAAGGSVAIGSRSETELLSILREAQ